MIPATATTQRRDIRLVGFDGDDTLWRSQDYFDAAQLQFEQIIGAYADIANARVHEHLYAVESRNLALFGYGVKGMALSMVEAAVEITRAQISATDLHRIVGLGKSLLQHPVELLPGIADAVAAIAADFQIVLITKGDLFHQESKVRQSGLADQFRRIEIVSEKDARTYARVLGEFGLDPGQFLMIGNSLRSDIVPVLQLGGHGIHTPYHLTWTHEAQAELAEDDRRWRTVDTPAALPAAVHAIAGSKASPDTVDRSDARGRPGPMPG